MSKKENQKKFENVGSVSISDWDADRLRELAAKREGIKMVIRVLSEGAGDLALKSWKLWESFRERYDFPTDDEAKVWYDPIAKAIAWRMRVDGV